MGFWQGVGDAANATKTSAVDALQIKNVALDPDISNGESAEVRFPSDFGSYGGFFTKITVYKWKDKPGQGPAQVSSTDQVLQGCMWLPYPGQLTANYAGNFAEANSMHDIGTGDIKEKLAQGGLDWARQKANNLDFTIADVGVNMGTDSAKMASQKVINNKVGAVYHGQQIRNHNFTWKLMPKNEKEQYAIHKVVKMFKLISTPGVGARKDLSILMGESATNDTNSANVQGNLNIPMTVRIEFFQGTDMAGGVGGLMPNPYLFKVKDAFITSVESNYTPTGMWNAFWDGAPIETSITISLKELGALTQTDIINGA